MGFYETDLSAVATWAKAESCQTKTDPRSENRVGGSRRFASTRTRFQPTQTLDTTSETSVTVTITVSGLPFWPSRDPIGEDGGLHLYGFVFNDPISLSDALGLAVHLWPLNGEAENHSSHTVEVKGDWFKTTCRLGRPEQAGSPYFANPRVREGWPTTVVSEGEWSRFAYNGWVANKKIRGYICDSEKDSERRGTHSLPAGSTMRGEHPENTFIVDSDHIVGADVTVYKKKDCCEEADLGETDEADGKIGGAVMRIYDCPESTGKIGVYLDRDLKFIPFF